MKLRSLFFIVCALWCTATILTAGTTGKITGRISDAKSGEPIPFATVTIAGTTIGTASDVDGKFIIMNIPPGEYAVVASLVGYRSLRKTNVAITVDHTTILDFPLQESSVEMNEVVVRGERPLVKHDQTNPVVAVSSENIQNLPVTSIGQIIGLQAGVVVADDGSIHIRGGRSNETMYALNGITLNNPYDNSGSISIATNAVQEVSVSIGTFTAEYGNALSGVVNYVTKEGGNRLTGSARILTGDYVTNRTDLYPEISKIDPLNTTRIEGTLGGPAFLDGLSFYASGVFEKGKGYLYGTRLYSPNDFYVNRNELDWRQLLYEANGQPKKDIDSQYVYAKDPRYNVSPTSPYYFNPLSNDTMTLQSSPTGNGDIVPLNTSESFNIQGNISYRFSPMMKLKYEAIYNQARSKDAYYYSFRYNPDGRPENFSNGIIHSLDWTHTLNNSMFYTVKGSYSKAENKSYTFENINDPGYLPGFYLTALPTTSFYTGGVSLWRGKQWTESMTGKIDMQMQLFDIHEVKVGAEIRQHTLFYESYSLIFVDVNDPARVITTFHDIYNDSVKIKSAIPSVDQGYTKYQRKSSQAAAYIQDKIELSKSLILNAGLRYEYFDPNAKFIPDLSGVLEEQRGLSYLTNGKKQAEPKHMISPRLSIAYPITDMGVIRFSYGHFYQFGSLASLYTNPLFRNPQGSRPVFGNADVKPQRSVQYEIGLQQGLTQNLKLEVAGFYKDVKDYIFTQIVVTANGDLKYEVLTNLDYANVRGLTLSLYQRNRPGELFSASLDYTFEVAEGNRTAPREDFFFSEKSGKPTETFLVPLSFDRTHTLNATMMLNQPDDFNISTIWRLRSGSPYTPSMPANFVLQQTQFVQSSGTKPVQFSIDLKAEKLLKIADVTFAVTLQVDNLLDTENETDVYSNSGRALYNADQVADPNAFAQTRNRIIRGDAGMIPLSAIDEYYKNPANVSRPRLVRLGLSFYF